nr:SRPBCC family protein [Actinomycetota bacterium]
DGNWVWAFVLEPGVAGTRPISRNRIATPDASIALRLSNRRVMEPGSLIMERKMLLGIKERSERLARAPSDGRA